jgi:phage tail-like protein
MAGFKYPFTGFHFIVFFEGLPGLGPQDFRFQEVSGITYSLGSTLETDGGDNIYAHNQPSSINYGTLTLKRGLFSGSGVTNWIVDTIENFTTAGAIENTVTINIFLLNEFHLPQEGWRYFNAYPKSYAVDGLNASEDRIVVESIQFNFTHFKRISPLSGVF